MARARHGRTWRGTTGRLLAVAALLGLPAVAGGQEPAGDDSADDDLGKNRGAGWSYSVGRGDGPSWIEAGGLYLSEHGGSRIVLDYTGELLKGFSGGERERDDWRYRGDVVFGGQLDLEEADIWDGGLLYASGRDGHGDDINADYVGTIQRLSTIDGDDDLQLGEVYLRQRLGWLTVWGGKLYAEGRFAHSENGSRFITPSFTRNPTIPMPTYPEPQWGGIARIGVLDAISLSAGYFSEAEHRFAELAGADLRPDGENGALLIGELNLSLRHFGAIRGSYRAGVWRDATALRSLEDPLAEAKDAHQGYYASVDEIIGSGATTLGLFGQYGKSSSASAVVNEYLGGGAVVLFATSDEAQHGLGCGVARAKVNDSLGRSLGIDEDETIVEGFWQITAQSGTTRFRLQPVLQRIYSPGGRFADAWAGGLRFELDI